MTPSRTKSKHGGKRKGAGRKPILNRGQRLTIALDELDYKAVERLATKREISIAAVIRDAVRAYLNRAEK